MRRIRFARESHSLPNTNKIILAAAPAPMPEVIGIDEEQPEDEPVEAAAEQLPYEAFSKGYWRGVAAVEGLETGDRRMFARESLIWRDLPLPLYWQERTADGHSESYAVGRIDTLERDGDLIRDTGQFDMGGEHGREAHRLAYERVIRGQSVSLDDVSDNDIEMVWPNDAMTATEDGEDGEDGGDEDDTGDEAPASLFVEPEMIIFNHGRIMDVNFTGNPAMQEAFLELIPDAEIDGESMPGEEGDDELVAATVALSSRNEYRVVPAHDTATTDSPWDGGAEEIKLRSPFPLSTARAAYAWIDEANIKNDEIARSSCRFIHHEVSSDGTPGAANLTACSSAIGVLNGARGGSTIPAGDRQGVYNHLANHIRDAGREPPELLSIRDIELRVQQRRLLAATMPVAPPLAWFLNPKFTEPTPLTLESTGQFFSHAALWGTCHTGYASTCVVPPREEDYSYFTTGEIVTDDGTRVPVGQVTFGTNHAAMELGARPSQEHYAHTGFVAADVAVGADKFGIWVAGAARPDLTPSQLRTIRAAGISCDWRGIRGRLRTIGMLMVNVPGFPIPRTRTYTRDGMQTSLVAAGIVVPRTNLVSPAVIEMIARSVGRDNQSRADELHQRVHPSLS